MTIESKKTADQAIKAAKTTVGNYFISNYPPYSFWTEDHVEEVHRALEREPRPGTPLGLYLHIPFCRRRCRFCYFKVYTDKNAGEIENYLEATIRELELYAAQPFIGGRKPRFIYFGGGTPSYISTRQFGRLVERMKALLPWDEAEEITFEAEPGTLNEKKLEIIREAGITRLSLGVENFDQEILELNGRAHGSKEIVRAYDYARAVGFPQINIDLIAGMIGETDSNWTDCVQKTIDLDPDSVTIYQMEIPYNTVIYREMSEQGREAAPVADWDTKREWVKQAFAALEEAGYSIASAYTAVRDPSATQFVYRDLLWRGADMVGLGVASFSHVGGTHFQNEPSFTTYLSIVHQEKRLPIQRALTPTGEERLIREFVLQMKLGRVNHDYFAEKFGLDVRERFAEPLQTLRDRGFLTSAEGGLRLSRDGLLQVDTLLPEFFLQKHQNARYT